MSNFEEYTNSFKSKVCNMLEYKTKNSLVFESTELLEVITVLKDTELSLKEAYHIISLVLSDTSLLDMSSDSFFKVKWLFLAKATAEDLFRYHDVRYNEADKIIWRAPEIEQL